MKSETTRIPFYVTFSPPSSPYLLKLPIIIAKNYCNLYKTDTYSTYKYYTHKRRYKLYSPIKTFKWTLLYALLHIYMRKEKLCGDDREGPSLQENSLGALSFSCPAARAQRRACSWAKEVLSWQMRLDWEGSERRFVRFARGEKNGTRCFKIKSLKAPTFWWGYSQVIPPLVNWFETLWKIFYLGRGFLIFTHSPAPKHFLLGPPAAYQDLSTCYDWSVKKSHCSIGPSGWREIRKLLPVIPWVR